METQPPRRPTAASADVGLDIAAVARLLADGTRAGFCVALADGRAWTATELARHAGVAPSTASEHLNLLVAGGLLVEERHGRHRYLRLSDPRAVALVEALADLAPRRCAAPRTLSAAGRQRALARARLCYDHLAGAVALAIADALTAQGLVVLEPEAELTPAGAELFAATGIAVPGGARRPAVRACLDWTERRPHLAGAVGAGLCAHALHEGWFTRIGTTRALALTEPGRVAFRQLLGVELGDREPGLESDQEPDSA
ncbi:ArsR/SmtB family transcription factor [Kitasatospora viridis]|uniref:ArsR family transcriptional regulator n=1 Tax=Kitasatospora viridis TaxID=281105 RepID=A0A561ULU2_9ACTN|nr:winged helix-turn-helix domain-containing protein [Kitasatospora viridis]TWG00297.1 ArsR family transcriptional regulator [Kitasatospora viridis]